MRRLILWATTAGTLAGAALLASGAQIAGAATGVACSASQQIVSVTAPAYARQGADLTATVSAQDPARVTNATVALLQGATTISSTPVTLTAASTGVPLTAPATGATLSVVVNWDQDAGAPAACSGASTVALPLIPAGAQAGKPGLPRLSGSFAVVERPYNYRAAPSRPKWTFTPACDVFACGVDLESSQGLELPLALEKSGLYHGGHTYGAAITATSCTVPHFHLYTIKNAYTSREDVYVRVRGSKTGAVTQISGSLVAVYTPTKAARKQGCDEVERAVEQFTGHR
jgi:hypothetical protein